MISTRSLPLGSKDVGRFYPSAVTGSFHGSRLLIYRRWSISRSRRCDRKLFFCRKQFVVTQVMDFDYMLFNFAACVLPPLLVSALAYYVIFVNVSRAGIALHSSHAPSTSKLRTSESGDALSRMSDHYRFVLWVGGDRDGQKSATTDISR